MASQGGVGIRMLNVMTIRDDDAGRGGALTGGSGERKAIVIDNGLQGAAKLTQCLH